MNSDANESERLRKTKQYENELRTVRTLLINIFCSRLLLIFFLEDLKFDL